MKKSLHPNLQIQIFNSLETGNLDLVSGNSGTTSPSNGGGLMSGSETSIALNNKSLLGGSGPGDNNNMLSSQQQPLQQLQPQPLTVNNGGLTITPQPMTSTTAGMTANSSVAVSNSMQQLAPCSSSSLRLDPVTTISSSGLFNPQPPPMMPGHLSRLEPVPQASLPKVKSEPVQLLPQHPHPPPPPMGGQPGGMLPYIKKEENPSFENNNGFGGMEGPGQGPNMYNAQLQHRLSPPTYKYSPLALPQNPMAPPPGHPGAGLRPTILQVRQS